MGLAYSFKVQVVLMAARATTVQIWQILCCVCVRVPLQKTCDS